MTPFDDVCRCLVRDLHGFEAELDGFPDDTAVWQSHPMIPNCTGTLALHVAGNLRHFVGATLGGTGYVRDRDAEFTRRDVPRAVLVAELRAARAEVEATLARLDAKAAEAEYPLEVGGHRLPVGRLLVHLATHLAYHLGQADIHRRVVTQDPRAVGAMSVRAIG